MDTNTWSILSPIILALAGGIAAILTVVLSQLAIKVRKWFDAKFGKENMDIAISFSEVIVGAVEEEAKKQGWDSQKKLDEAVERLRIFLEARKIYFSTEEMKDLVHSALQMMREVWESYKKGEVVIREEAVAPVVPGSSETIP